MFVGCGANRLYVSVVNISHEFEQLECVHQGNISAAARFEPGTFGLAPQFFYIIEKNVSETTRVSSRKLKLIMKFGKAKHPIYCSRNTPHSPYVWMCGVSYVAHPL